MTHQVRAVASSLQRRSVEDDVRKIRFHCAHHPHTVWLVAVTVTLLSLAACHGGPVLDLSPKPLEADGTISGTVRGPEGTSPIEGRSVEVINVDTSERQRATTNNSGVRVSSK